MVWNWHRDAQGNVYGNNQPDCPQCGRAWRGNHHWWVNIPVCNPQPSN